MIPRGSSSLAVNSSPFLVYGSTTFLLDFAGWFVSFFTCFHVVVLKFFSAHFVQIF